MGWAGGYGAGGVAGDGVCGYCGGGQGGGVGRHGAGRKLRSGHGERWVRWGRGQGDGTADIDNTIWVYSIWLC